jgi:hypothetical protein
MGDICQGEGTLGGGGRDRVSGGLEIGPNIARAYSRGWAFMRRCDNCMKTGYAWWKRGRRIYGRQMQIRSNSSDRPSIY